MKRLASFSLVGLVLAITGCTGSGGPEAFAANSYDSPTIPGVEVPPPPGADGKPIKTKASTRVGLQQNRGPLPPPSQ
ncbi:hypothetical protein [Paludisphaera sp.]|uniref:hypothetical protein n=1 Tax=Paludisphaera sp. TaxID=2017432 RepID=UPI00301E4F7D